MIRRDEKDKTNILKAVNLQLKNLREQRHTESGEIFAIQAVWADLQQAVSVCRTLKEEWTDRLPVNAFLTEDEWEELAADILIPSADATYLPTEGGLMSPEAYRALCASLKSSQEELSALITDIKELLSHPAKEKLEAFYNDLLADYEQKWKVKEKRKVWRKIRDASDTEEKQEMLQTLMEDARRTFLESGFLTIKANGFSPRKHKTEEERIQAAYDSLVNADGKPNLRAVRKYIFFHKAELKDAQVKAWLHYDLMLKIVAEEMAYSRHEAEASKDDLGEMAEALKTLYLPRCYALLAEGRDAAWVGTFVDDLLKSKHGSALCADWQMEKKRPQVVATVLGLLVEADAMKGSNAEVARMYNKGNDDRTFAKYVGNGRRSDYAEWATDYAMQAG